MQPAVFFMVLDSVADWRCPLPPVVGGPL